MTQLGKIAQEGDNETAPDLSTAWKWYEKALKISQNEEILDQLNEIKKKFK